MLGRVDRYRAGQLVGSLSARVFLVWRYTYLASCTSHRGLSCREVRCTRVAGPHLDLSHKEPSTPSRCTRSYRWITVGNLAQVRYHASWSCDDIMSYRERPPLSSLRGAPNLWDARRGQSDSTCFRRHLSLAWVQPRLHQYRADGRHSDGHWHGLEAFRSIGRAS